MWKFSKQKHLFSFLRKQKPSVQIQSFYDGPFTVHSLQANSALLKIFKSPYALNLFKQTYDLIPCLFLFNALSKKKSNPVPWAHWGPSWQSYLVSSAPGHREDEPLPRAAQSVQRLWVQVQQAPTDAGLEETPPSLQPAQEPSGRGS